jgi:hypothetical protein
VFNNGLATPNMMVDPRQNMMMMNGMGMMSSPNLGMMPQQQQQQMMMVWVGRWECSIQAWRGNLV